MAIMKTDLTLHIDRTGNMVVGKNNEYLTGIIQMLFAMKPGTDEYDLERGLDIHSMKFKSHVSGTRDTSYEIEIAKQFAKYTDLVPTNVVAMFVDDILLISMTALYGSDVLQISITTDKMENLAINFRQ